MHEVYIITTYLSIAAIITATCCLLGFSIPRGSKSDTYRTAIRFLAIAYAILGLAGICELATGKEHANQKLVLAFTIIVAAFQAFLFTACMIILIRQQPISRKRVSIHLIGIIFLSTLLLITLFCLPRTFFLPVLLVCVGSYILLLIYYVYWFLKEYKRQIEKLGDFFSDNEEQSLRWIRHSFFSAFSIGVLSLCSLLMPLSFHMAFVALYTLFYVFFAIKTINYFNTFHRLAAVNVLPEPVTSFPHTYVPGTELFVPKLEEWVSQKRFKEQGITLQSLAKELRTNQTYLSNYINTTTRLNFRNWISKLRIDEAKVLLLERTNLPLSHIAEEVGIPSKSSFHRQFIHVTGKTPGEYKKMNSDQ